MYLKTQVKESDQVMRLKDVVQQLVIDPRKLTAYALDMDNPKSVDKALMFRQCLGFTKENYHGLLAQIQDKAMNAEAVPGKSDKYGQRYRVDILVDGVEPNQQDIVRTGWIVKPDESLAKLVTLYIPRRK